MNTISPEAILNIVTEFFLASRAFNGISARSLFNRFEVEWQEFYDPICQLIEADLVGIIYSDVHLNPHIIRIGFEEKKSQINKEKLY